MLESLLLVIAVSADSLAAAIGLGSAGIRVPIKSSFVICLIGTVSLALSVLLASFLQNLIPQNACRWLSFSLLMILGIYSLIQEQFRKVLRRRAKKKNLAMGIYLDESEADKDCSKTLSPGEAAVLSVALSADSVVTGVSAGFMTINILLLTITSLAFGMLCINFGSGLGRKLASKTSVDLGWLCGTILIALAAFQLFG